MMQPVPLRQAREEALYGGKCVSLSRALNAGLPVPDGFALAVPLVSAVAVGEADSRRQVLELFPSLAPSLAVRSSAVGEDSNDASFAGQHLSVLNVMSAAAMLAAVEAVHASAHTPEALAYRQKMRIAGSPAIAVALQRQVASETAGVLFTRNPVSGADERFIEASWGLGEVVVGGLVISDNYRLGRDGRILDRTAGDKDVMLVADATGNVVEQTVAEDRVNALCLSDLQLQQLHELAAACQGVYGAELDIEWAFAGGRLYLLQCRAITR